MPEEEIGVITHYYGHIQVAGIKIERGKLKIGDRIHVLGHTSDFEQTIDSMQIDHASVEEAGPADDVGVRVVDHVREHDKVFLVTD